MPGMGRAAATSSRSSIIRYRNFPPSAVDQLMHLYAQAWWAGHRRKRDVVRMLRATSLAFSAWEGRRLVGFCRVLSDFTYRAVLYDVIVDESVRGRGIGQEMIRRLHAHPRLRRVESWYLSTKDQHAFYERLGWTRQPEKFMEFKASNPRPHTK
jgi:GNAT superfamily N-acetyltransferase